MQKKKIISIVSLLFCAMISIPMFASSVSASSPVFGQTNKGWWEAWQPAGAMVASSFYSSADGVPSSISVYIGNPTGYTDKVKGAIYDDSSQQLVAVTEAKTVPAWQDGWMTLNVESAEYLSSGWSYSLVVWFEGVGCYLYYSSGAFGQSWYANEAFTGSFSNGPYSSFPLYGLENTAYSIYATIGSEGIQYSPTAMAASQPITLGRTMYQSNSFSTQTYAAESDMWVGHISDLYRVPQIHASNPDVIALIYRNIRTIWRSWSPEYVAAEYQLFMNNGWILEDAWGNYVTTEGGQGFLVDIGNPSYQQWLARWCADYINAYGANGVYFDYCQPNSEIVWAASATPINPRTWQAYSSWDWEQAVIGLVNTVKDAIGSNLVIGNAYYSPTHFYRSDLWQSNVDLIFNSRIDGVHSEAWISSWDDGDWYSEADWKKGIDMAAYIDGNFLSRGGKIFWTTSENAGLGSPEGQVVLNYGISREQYATYCYTSRLLAASNDGNFMYFGTFTSDYCVQSLFQTNIGGAVNDYYVIGGSHVYTRDFSNGKVLVNPTSTPYYVGLGGLYYFEDGTAVSALTVNPHTGIILYA